jgi:hypothetical protein
MYLYKYLEYIPNIGAEIAKKGPCVIIRKANPEVNCSIPIMSARVGTVYAILGH